MLWKGFETGSSVIAADALSHEPEKSTVRNTYGVALFRVGRHREARDVFKELVELNTDHKLSDLVFLVMSCAALNERAQAEMYLGRLRVVLSSDRSLSKDDKGFISELEAALMAIGMRLDAE